MNVNKYNDFIFESIMDEIFIILEADQSYTYEWDIKKKGSTLDKLRRFLSGLSKDKVMEYLFKFLKKIKIFSETNRRLMLINYVSIFLIFLSTDYIKSSFERNNEPEISKVKKELIEVMKKSNFEQSQEHVSLAEGGYSNDKKDTGNFVELGNGLKRFVGSKFGISAPILKDYLGKLPSKEDMKNLSYDTALKIYKDRYWDDQNITHFCNQSIATTIYDACVNQGIGGTKVIVKKALRENGISIGKSENPFKPEWIKKANSLNQEKLFNSIKKFRENRYKDSSTWEEHGDGWIKRLNKIVFE